MHETQLETAQEQQLRAREERHSRRFGARQRLSEAREERRRLEASSAQLTWQLQESERTPGTGRRAPKTLEKPPESR